MPLCARCQNRRQTTFNGVLHPVLDNPLIPLFDAFSFQDVRKPVCPLIKFLQVISALVLDLATRSTRATSSGYIRAFLARIYRYESVYRSSYPSLVLIQDCPALFCHMYLVLPNVFSMSAPSMAENCSATSATGNILRDETLKVPIINIEPKIFS